MACRRTCHEGTLALAHSMTASARLSVPISRNGSYGTSSWACRSLRLDVGGPDDVAPLLRLVGDELAKVGGREREHVATQVGKPHLDLGVGEARVDLPVELVDDFSRRVFWCAD